MAILDCRVSGLHVPLMAIINYRGFSLIAQSYLPVNNNTVICGTADGGATVHASDEQFNEKMKVYPLHLLVVPKRWSRASDRVLTCMSRDALDRLLVGCKDSAA
jgi:hypothetical protein